jgi:hypothetical protein
MYPCGPLGCSFRTVRGIQGTADTQQLVAKSRYKGFPASFTSVPTKQSPKKDPGTLESPQKSPQKAVQSELVRAQSEKGSRRDSADKAATQMSGCQEQGETLSPRGVLEGFGSFADSCNSSPASGTFLNQGGWSPQNCRKSLLSPISTSSEEGPKSDRQKPCLTLWKSMSMRRWNTFPASNQKAPKRSPSNFLAQSVLRLCQGPHPLTPSPSLDREAASAALCSVVAEKPHWRFFSADELCSATDNFNPGEFVGQ